MIADISITLSLSNSSIEKNGRIFLFYFDRLYKCAGIKVLNTISILCYRNISGCVLNGLKSYD